MKIFRPLIYSYRLVLKGSLRALLGVVVVGAFACTERQTVHPGVWAPGPDAAPVDLLGIDLVEGGKGFAVGDLDPKGLGGVMYATADGGRSWQPLTRTNEILTSVHFVDSNRGWVAGFAGRIARTDDGGRTWRIQRAEYEAEALNSIYFVDNQRGWVAGGGGMVLRTTDGGGSWVEVDTGRVEDLWCIRFVTAERGWIAGDEGLILSTEDGGLSWKSQSPAGGNALYGVAVTISGAVLAVGRKGTIIRSDDGIAWQAINSPTQETLNAVAAFGSDVLWAVGSNGTAVYSVDGGRTWSLEMASAGRTLLALDVLPDGTGAAVGRRGATAFLQPERAGR